MATVFYTDRELEQFFEVKTISVKQKRDIILLVIFDICMVVLMLGSCIMDSKKCMVYKNSDHEKNDHSELEQSSTEVNVSSAVIHTHSSVAKHTNAAISADTIDFNVADTEIAYGTRFKNAILFYSRVLSIFWQYDP